MAVYIAACDNIVYDPVFFNQSSGEERIFFDRPNSRVSSYGTDNHTNSAVFKINI